MVPQEQFGFARREVISTAAVRPERSRGQWHQERKKERWFLWIFKNLFKKKEKEEVDTTEYTQPKASDDFDYVENDSIKQHQQDSIRAAQPAEKKGLFKKKKKDEAPLDEAVPAEKPKKKRREKAPDMDAVSEPEKDAVKEDAEEEEEVESF